MRAKYYIGILSALLLTGMSVNAQYTDDVYLNTDEEQAAIDSQAVINNYHDNNYYYSSRINRFHRSYSLFDYYSPIYTDTYWYSYNPYSLGISIYSGGPGFSLGYNFNYPFYYINNYSIDLGWYNPYYGSSYYWGYNPYYYNSYWSYDPYICDFWYSPYYSNWGYRDRWSRNSWGWNRNNFRNDRYYSRNEYRPGYNSGNFESRRLTPATNDRQGSIPSDMRRPSSNRTNVSSRPASAGRPNISSRPVNNYSGRSVMSNQSGNRRSVSQPALRNSNMNSQPSTRRYVNQPVNRNMSRNLGSSSQQMSGRSSAGPSRSSSGFARSSSGPSRSSSGFARSSSGPSRSSSGSSRSNGNGRR